MKEKNLTTTAVLVHGQSQWWDKCPKRLLRFVGHLIHHLWKAALGLSNFAVGVTGCRTAAVGSFETPKKFG